MTFHSPISSAPTRLTAQSLHPIGYYVEHCRRSIRAKVSAAPERFPWFTEAGAEQEAQAAGRALYHLALSSARSAR